MSREQALGARVASARQAAGFNQTEMAAMLRDAGHSFHQQTVQKVETGARKIGALELHDLAGMLGVTVADLIGVDDLPAVDFRAGLKRAVDILNREISEMDG